MINALTIEREIPNRDLLYVSYDTEIPRVNRGVGINISFDKNGNIKVGSIERQIPDPSTIYIHLPICEEIDVERLPYWPHYIEMTPGQRFKYLCWLRDVTQPIDMGYVFIYYYGLEKKMLTENFDRAFDEIVKLRNFHENKSFLRYSENALIHGAILRNRLDKLVDLDERTEVTRYSNALFLIAHKERIGLGASQLALVCGSTIGTAKKAIKDDKPLYLSCLQEVLDSEHGGSLVISDYDISKVKPVAEQRFANYSFSRELQYVTITDFYSCKQIMGQIETIHNIAYDRYKKRKAIAKSNKTPEEAALALKKRDENRYKRLLKEKSITQEEYNVLVSYLESKPLSIEVKSE